jgi:hypothetical protein
MFVTLGPSAMISDLNLLLFYDDTCCLDHLQVYTHIIVRNPRPQSDNNGITGGDGYDVRITCVH